MRKTAFLLTYFIALLLALRAAGQTSGYQAGDKAADFSLKGVDGKMVFMAGNPSAKGYILVFTSNTCPFAQAYEDRMIALHRKYAPQGYSVIAVNPSDPVASPQDAYAAVQARAEQKRFPFPYVTDETQQVAKTYGATRTPQVFVVQKQQMGYVVQYTGAIDDNSQNANDVQHAYVEEAMAEILAGKPVGTKATKATGCTIKFKNP